MLNLKIPREFQNLLAKHCYKNHIQFRSIVSAEFSNRNAWQARLAAPVFKQIKMQDYFVTLDKKFTQEFRGSAIDVDIFANNVQNSSQAEHMEELMFKLRRTPHTLHTLDSTHHAAVRAMLDFGSSENLVKMLDDRMNYGLFLDEYSAVLVLDKFLDIGDNQAAARCASQLMLQEENFKIANALGNLACWRYISSSEKVDWFFPDEIQVDENPDEVIRVRVKTVPNKYTDDHFDLRDPDRILGKTFIHFNKNSNDIVSRSLFVLGEHLFGSEDSVIAKLKDGGEVAKAVLEILQQSSKENIVEAAKSAKSADIDIDARLLEVANSEIKEDAANMIQQQKDIYQKWQYSRDQELKRHYESMQKNARIQSIEETKAQLTATEEQLFFFDNQDSYDMELVEKEKAFRRTLPRTNWNISNFSQNKYYKKKLAPDGERKIARWEKRDKKLGPPK